MIGINLQLFDGTTTQASLTGIQALWWDVTEPKDGSSPIGKSAAVATDSSGYVNLDLSNVTGLTIGDYGFLMLYKLDATDHKDSLVFAGKVQTSDISSGVDMYYYDSGWTRPIDWPALDAIADGVQKIQGVYAVYDIETAGNAVAITIAGTYTVDWGDGSAPENFATGVSAEHTYDYADTDLGAVTSRGYKCAVITITPQSGQNLTSVNFNDRHATFSQVNTSPWLDISINGEYITALTIGSPSQVCRKGLLEQVTIGEQAVTTMANMFYGCSSLQSVPLFSTGAVTTMTYMFYGCSSLRSVPLFSTGAVTTMANMFQSCSSLQSVPLFSTGAVTTMANMFYGCSSLRYAALSGTNVDHSFLNCSLGPEALNAIYTGLSATGTGKTITVTGNWGVSSDDPSIATTKGWTVTS